jgi:ABC-type branched-subunit amino acid transport system substrate-binding protein
VCQNSLNFTAAFAQLMATKPYRKYYIICQDYAWGHDVAKAFKKQLKIYLPDAEIVGEDYHPLFTKDFGPYINKVIASGADAIFSGNWGADSRLLVKQARALGLKAPFPMVMTFGTDPTVENEIKDDAIGIHFVYDYSMRVDTPENKAFIAKWRETHKDDEELVTQWPATTIGHAAFGMAMFLAAVEKAGTLDTEKIIETFEGFWYKTPVGWWAMRKCDHQAILPMFGGVIEGGENPYYDFPWVGSVQRFPAFESAIPPTSDYNMRCP